VFGPVHGITLGFGATLIGEAVDYPSYAFIQATRGERLADTVERIGPTLRLAVLTTVFGASAMALSSFQGLAQLGVLTMVGVGVAGLTTRRVLPALAPDGWVSRKAHALPFDAERAVAGARRGFRLVAALVAVAVAVIVWKHDRLWEDDIANLSPLPESARALDMRLRAELGAADFRYSPWRAARISKLRSKERRPSKRSAPGRRARLDLGIRLASPLPAQPENAGAPPRRAAGRGNAAAQPRAGGARFPVSGGTFRALPRSRGEGALRPVPDAGEPARVGVRAESRGAPRAVTATAGPRSRRSGA
jgi:hypothetical protein